MTDSPEYQVYAIRFAHRDASYRWEHFYRGDPHGGAPMPIDYFVWVATSPEATVVFDAGYTPETAARRGNRDYLQSPMETLGALGIDASTVEHLAISHLHYDHVGHIKDFPAARVLIQQKEWDFWNAPSGSRGDNVHHWEPGDMEYIASQIASGRVELVDGEVEVVPGITLHRTGGHTAGLQIFRIQTAAGHVVLTADASHFYENIGSDRPYALVDHLYSMHLAFDTIRELADSEELIVPGHDPLVLERFPAVDGLEGLAVRIA
ncbi:N-acyl homoserine lactonase family protein [Compostimonas suwonensis]|uniref:Glyoxylase-like metal-dependent hydrolase (Beta-lactamase superfamily II) n=1 Tax=Compostimonas suwonensis TaxID=1048394 RepID=A0A2M9BCE5_9MICO|nr:N-acyl homoserine lactonase family protein [Compostimonas suwonensis]PJJ55613.1 glyoxylase-like metal-dependent hydrolase (beta-lactamase superfamily II) [Compostimonas suwonensis]